MDLARLTVVHRRRLRAVWRSAGWPCQDLVEVELLAAGWLERVRDAAGRDTLRVTDAGVQALADTLQANRDVREPHEALVARVAREMQRAGRIVWRGLALRAPLPAPAADEGAAPATRWVVAMPDVYSIRHTTREDQALPVVHEVKVRRADLLGELRRPDKAEAYRALASECWYVLKAGIASADEIPPAFGVMQAHPSPDGGFGALEVLRPAPRRPYLVPFAVWMALARAPADPADDDAQAALGEGQAAGE
ncbi:hypothetical protein [Ideonella sp.]|uniref:hypothetical protein n=1 Tax=Ideonella sp. TaxID=1929293 RepID=UPI0035B42BE5